MPFTVTVCGFEIKCDTPEEAIAIASRSKPTTDVAAPAAAKVERRRRARAVKHDKICKHCRAPFSTPFEARNFCTNRCARADDRELRSGPSNAALEAVAAVLKAKRVPMEAVGVALATGVDLQRVLKHLKVLRAAKRVRLHRNRVGGSAYSSLERGTSTQEVSHEVSSPTARPDGQPERAPERGDAAVGGQEDSDGSRTTTAAPLAAPSVKKKMPPPEEVEHTVVWSGASRKPVPGCGGDRLGQLGSTLNPNVGPASWPSFRKS